MLVDVDGLDDVDIFVDVDVWGFGEDVEGVEGCGQG